MSNPLYQQQAKTLLLQVIVGALMMGVLLVLDSMPWVAIGYSVMMGLAYSLLLSVGVSLSNQVSNNNPQMGMVVLAVSAVTRFILIGLLLIYGMSQWGDYPLGLILPFASMLITPFLLIVNKKRLTD